MTKLLQIENLSTHFYTENGIVKAVDGISYHLDEGETLGLVGESGCGKSVSALSIMGLVSTPPGKIVDGKIKFDGNDLLKLNDSEMRRIRGNDIGMIFQEPMTSLNPVLTIGRQITESMELHLNLSRKSSRDRAVELLDLVGIPDPIQRLNDYPHHLSGGMRQRVMIAIAISCNPRLLIADEPTTALDVTIQAQILELMQSLCKEFGMALIIITHNLGIIARYAARVMVMYAGKIIETGTSQQIYHNQRHPYTQGLLKSVPRLDLPAGSQLHPIDGLPPDLIDLPAGCSFSPRCGIAIGKCKTQTPELMQVEDHHYSACWRWNDMPIISEQASDNERLD